MGSHPRLPFDGQDRDERREALAHLRSCASCRAAWVADRPERLFALLDDAPVPPAVLDELTVGVFETLGIGRARGLGRRAAAWAAGLAMAAVLVGLGVTRRGPELVRAQPAAGSAVSRAGVDLLESPGLGRVVDLTVGEAQVVMIFDSEIEL